MTDSPKQDNLEFLPELVITANHSFIRWHGKQIKPRYHYLYSKEELRPWVDKVKMITSETAVMRGYFNNHYGGRAVINAIEFKEMSGTILSVKEKDILNHARNFISQYSRQSTFDDSLTP